MSVVALLVALAVVPVGLARADVRYAGHVAYTNTQCCGFQDAVFKVFGRKDVPYTVCVRRPDDSTRCKSRRTRDSGVPSHAAFLSDQIGGYSVTWSVSGSVRDSSHYVVNVEEVMAPDGPSSRHEER